MAGPERTVENKIIAKLQDYGILVLALQLVGGRGWPDITCFYKGKICCIECKRLEGGKISPHQWQVSEALHAQGIKVFFGRDMNAVKDVLYEFDIPE